MRRAALVMTMVFAACGSMSSVDGGTKYAEAVWSAFSFVRAAFGAPDAASWATSFPTELRSRIADSSS